MPATPKALLSFPKVVSASAGQPKLYCFAYAGGSAAVYAAWARALAPAISVIGMEMPGHGSRFQETPFDSVAEMAAHAAEAIGAAGGEDYAFYGHSLGAIVAFEAARILQSTSYGLSRVQLKHLYVGAARAPQLPPTVPPVSHLPGTEFLDAVQQRYGGLPAALFDEPELLEMVLPVLRADFHAYENYQYLGSAPLLCPVTAFHGTEDPVVRTAAVGEWSRVTQENFRLEQLPGDHFFLNTSRDVLLTHITEFLEPGAGADRSNLFPHLATAK